jgi:hypothetical protein
MWAIRGKDTGEWVEWTTDPGGGGKRTRGEWDSREEAETALASFPLDFDMFEVVEVEDRGGYAIA